MMRGGMFGVVLTPVSEILSRLIVQAYTTAMAAKEVLIEQSNFNELSGYLERLIPVLKELQEKNIRETPPLRLALESFDCKIKEANELIHECTSKSRFYLLYNCRVIVKRLQDITIEIGRCVNLIPIATLDVSLETRDMTFDLQRHMQAVAFKAAEGKEEILEKLDIGMRERQGDSDHAKSLLYQIAQMVGVSNDPSSLREELEKLKDETKEAFLRKSQAEAMQLQQIICFLGQVDDLQSASKRESDYNDQKRRNSSSSSSLLSVGQPLPPLKSFFCPMNHTVMEDPVEIASGQTFERTIIKKWFDDGNKTCPITKVELSTLEMQPNISLRNSIKEWKDRNTFITIAATKSRLDSEEEENILNTLTDVRRLCEEKSIHRDWIRAEGLIPVITGLLSSNKHMIRRRALTTLQSLAIDNATNRDKIAEAGAIQYAVRSLARDVQEGRNAVSLLLELSKNSRVCEQVGKVQGCILLLVTMSTCADQAAAEDAKQILTHLSNNNQNVVQMAEANHFKPLVQCLFEGSEMTKILMASVLARMELTDQSKGVVAMEGAIPPLVRMISNGKLEARTAALGALLNLSTHPENRDPMISAGVIPPLLKLLFSVTSVRMNLKETASETLANLATAAPLGFDNNTYSSILDSEETIYQLLSLLNLVGPVIQGHLLSALHGMAAPSTAITVRSKMRSGGAIQLLLPFCEANNTNVRVNAVKLLYSLSQDGKGKELAEDIGENHIQAFVNLIASSREDERAAAAGIISNLPQNDSHLTEVLYMKNALPALTELLRVGSGSMSPSNNRCMEVAARAMIRFTLPSDVRMQRFAVEQNAIPLLLTVLSRGSPLAKKEAAIVLSQLSENSKKLSNPIDIRANWCCFVFSKPEPVCIVHQGHCSVRSSFCLIQSEAIGPLVSLLEEENSEAHEAALSALTTLMKDDEILEKGMEVIDEAGGLKAIVRLLTFVTDPAVKVKACWMLERFFRVEKYKSEFGAQAQMPLIDLAQKGTLGTKSLAAKCLAHLKVLHNQSTYF